MKDPRLICHGDPCTMRLDDPSLQTLEEAHARGGPACRYYNDRAGCAPPRFGCVQFSGLKVARYVLLLYSEVSEQDLDLEMDEFRRLAPLPSEGVEGYIDTPERSGRLITDPEQVLARVRAFARAVLDLRPGERIFRGPEETIYPLEKHWREETENAMAKPA